MENILLKVASISPAEIKIDAETEKYWAKFNIIQRIGSIFYNINTVLFFVNFVICLFTMRKIKNNRILCIISIIIFCLNTVYPMMYSIGATIDSDSGYDINYYLFNTVMVVSIFIIQFFIFIKLIRNIKRNHKEKEEP